jgi:hypothetical protein
MYPVLGKKLNWRKTGIEAVGVSLGEGKPRNRTSVILIGRGVLGGREKLSTKKWSFKCQIRRKSYCFH